MPEHPPPHITLRPALPSDRPVLRALTIEAFEGVSIDHNTDLLLGPTPNASSWQDRKARHADDDLDHPHGEVLVAEHPSGLVVGFISLRFDPDARVGRIPNLAVSSSFRGQGIGRSLLLAALDRFRARGMALARIETLEQNPIGRHLYPSVGFVEVARQIHFALRLDPPPSPS